MKSSILFGVPVILSSVFLHADQGPKVLKDADLGALVTSLGYTITNKDATFFDVTITKDGFTIPVQFQLSANGQYVWLTTGLGTLDDTDMADAKKLSAILLQDSAIEPNFMVIKKYGTADKPSYSLEMNSDIENRDVTGDLLKPRIDAFVAAVTSSASTWVKPAPKPAGK